MTWSMLTTDEAARFDAGDLGPDEVFWSMSICGVPISTSGHDLDHSLTVLYELGLHSAVRDVLCQVDHTCADHRCLADWYTGYGMLGGLARLLERSPQACAYVLALGDVSDEGKSGYIRAARDMARAALAKHYANEALSERGFSCSLRKI